MKLEKKNLEPVRSRNTQNQKRDCITIDKDINTFSIDIPVIEAREIEVEKTKSNIIFAKL